MYSLRPTFLKSVYTFLFFLGLTMPIYAQPSDPSVFGIPTFYLIAIMLIVHLPFVLISFFFAVNSKDYSDKAKKETLIVLTGLVAFNALILLYPILKGAYIYPIIIIGSVPIAYIRIGYKQISRPFLTWGLATVYMFNLIWFCFGGYKNYYGWGPKRGAYISYYDANKSKKKKVERFYFGLRDGLYEEFYKNGQPKIVLTYSKDTLSGAAKRFYKNGQVKISHDFKDALIHGTYNSYFESGELESERTFDNGVLIGEDVVYYENGQTASRVNYNENGEKEGLWEDFYPGGQLKLRCNYDENLEGEFVAYHSSQQEMERGMLKGNSKDGYWETYYDNGALESAGFYWVGDYDNAIKHGLWKTYYPNGQLKTVGEYERGLRTGEWTKYYDNGRESDRREY